MITKYVWPSDWSEFQDGFPEASAWLLLRSMTRELANREYHHPNKEELVTHQIARLRVLREAIASHELLKGTN